MQIVRKLLFLRSIFVKYQRNAKLYLKMAPIFEFQDMTKVSIAEQQVHAYFGQSIAHMDV